jgi:hypothetical protein
MSFYNTQHSAVHILYPQYHHYTTLPVDEPMDYFSADNTVTTIPHQVIDFCTYKPYLYPYGMDENNMSWGYLKISSAMSSRASYDASSALQQLHTVEEPYGGLAPYEGNIVKSESASPVQSTPMDRSASNATRCKQSSSKLAEATMRSSASRVDILMRAIQANPTTSPQKKEAAKVSHYGPILL